MLCGVVQGCAGGLRRFRDELRMWGYMRGVREWSGLVLSGKDGSGGGSECHVTETKSKLQVIVKVIVI